MRIFRALKIRNYRLYWLGIFCSQMGYWLQVMGLSHLIYRLTHSEYLLGAIAFCAFIPILPLSMVVGVWVDRVNRKRALVITQILALMQALTLAVLSFHGSIQIWHMLTLSLLSGIISAFDMPLRQTILGDLVEDRKLLPNAIALNSLQFNVARIIGPAIAAVIILYTEEAWCFLLNALSYLCILFSISQITWQPHIKSPAQKPHFLRLWLNGFQYVYHEMPLRMLLTTLIVTALTIGTYSAIVPALASHLFNGTADVQSYILACAGFGAILGNLWLANSKGNEQLLYAIAIMGVITSLTYIFMSMNTQPILGYFLFILIGAGNITTGAASNSLLQLLAKPERRGQIMSFYVAAFIGCYPIGSLLVGWSAEQIGLRQTLFAIGCIAFINISYFIYRLSRVIPIVQLRLKENNMA